MSGVDVAALREKLAKATPGPWHWTRGPNGGYIRKGRRDLGYMNGDVAAIGDPKAQQIDNDAEAIVALVNAAPALLDEIDALRARLARQDAVEAEFRIEIEMLRAELAVEQEHCRVLNAAVLARDARLARQDAVIEEVRAMDHARDCRRMSHADGREWIPCNCAKGAVAALDVLDTPAEPE